MDLLQFQKGIKELVANDKLNEALDHIIKFSQAEDGFDDLENSAIINSGKLDRIEREKMEDRINPEDYAVQRSQVSAAILLIIGELKTPQVPVTVPSSNPESNSEKMATANSVSQQEIQSMIVNNNKIFVKIILGGLVLFAAGFIFFLSQKDYVLGGAFFTAGAGTCFTYLNNQKRMLQTISSSI